MGFGRGLKNVCVSVSLFQAFRIFIDFDFGRAIGQIISKIIGESHLK